MVAALSPRAFIESPKITATTTTARMLLFEPSTSTTFDGTALITVVNGLYASSVATLEVVVSGIYFFKKVNAYIYLLTSTYNLLKNY